MTTYLEHPSSSVPDVTAAPKGPRRVPAWIAAVSGVSTLLLVGLAVGDVGTQVSVLGDRLAGTAETDTPAPSAEPAPPAPAVVAVPEVSVIATPCRPRSTNGVTADGSVAYCVRLQSTDTYLWSLSSGEVAMPARSSMDPAVAICMSQTLRSALDCGEYLARPSNPGDGGLRGGVAVGR